MIIVNLNAVFCHKILWNCMKSYNPDVNSQMLNFTVIHFQNFDSVHRRFFVKIIFLRQKMRFATKTF